MCVINMGPKKRKNVIILTLCVATSFIIYQMYFFWALMSDKEVSKNIVMPIADQQLKHVYSKADKYINENGVLRGVFYINMNFYRPDSKAHFKCLKSEQTIPFEFVNDDFCDCADSTDEPSTSACPNGTFYCDTQFMLKPVALHSVPSGKVNDGICDCCDGSDEWLNGDKKLLSQNFPNNAREYVSKCSNYCR